MLSDTQRLDHLIRNRLCLNNDDVPLAWYVMDMAGEAVSNNHINPRDAIDESVAVLAEQVKVNGEITPIDYTTLADNLKWLTEVDEDSITAGVGDAE